MEREAGLAGHRDKQKEGVRGRSKGDHKCRHGESGPLPPKGGCATWHRQALTPPEASPSSAQSPRPRGKKLTGLPWGLVCVVWTDGGMMPPGVRRAPSLTADSGHWRGRLPQGKATHAPEAALVTTWLPLSEQPGQSPPRSPGLATPHPTARQGLGSWNCFLYTLGSPSPYLGPPDAFQALLWAVAPALASMIRLAICPPILHCERPSGVEARLT